MAVDTQDAAPRAVEKTSGGRLNRRRGAAVREAPDASAPVALQKPKVPPTDEISKQESATTRSERVAAFIETIEVQAAIVSLIAFDVVSTVVSLLLRAHHEILRLQSVVEKSSSSKKQSRQLHVETSPSPSMTASIVLRLLDSLAGFTIVLFVIELTFLAWTFRCRFLTHFGYTTDVIVVGASIALEIYTESNVARLLGILRLWRAFRLVGMLLEREQNDHEVTRDALDVEKTRVLQLQYEKQAAEQSLQRELESRAGVERMLQGYKDEADTLREALTIAAQAVAEATMMPPAVPEESDGVEGTGEGVTYDYDPAYAYDATQTTEATAEAYGEVVADWTADGGAGENYASVVGMVDPQETLDVSDHEDDTTFTDAISDNT